ncbi:SRF-TF-domain-containing protein [Mucor ambiguus]|uniref:SRF-TF-domain-containing protein n=1 Tax=Mucor ambiguus TaxID=91626 RepID=A0A0C9LU78_9FUNG|nr:SRF-TF-domain-containing protein [Mucor ambiguus]
MDSINCNYPAFSHQLHFESPSSNTADAQQDMDSDDADSRPGKRSGRRKIKIEYIENKSRRHITFSKRKAGIMKKAYELSTLTGTQVFLLVVSETGLVYTFTTPKLQPLVTRPEGKSLIQECLNAPDVSHLSMENVTAQAAAQAHPHAMQQYYHQQMNTTATVRHSIPLRCHSQRSSEIHAQLDRKPSFTGNYSPLYSSPYQCSAQQQQKQLRLPPTYPPTPQECVGKNNSNEYWQQRNTHHSSLPRQL